MKKQKNNISTKPQRVHTYDIDRELLRVTERNAVIREEPFPFLNPHDNGRSVSPPASLTALCSELNSAANTMRAYQENAKTLQVTTNNLLESIRPALDTRKQLYESFMEPARRLNERMVEIVDSIRPLNEAILTNTQVLNSMNSVSITLGQSLSELQNGVFEQFRDAAVQSYVPIDFEAPTVLRNRVELPIAPIKSVFDDDHTRTLKIDVFKPVANNEYSLTTTVSSIAAYQPLIYERLETVEMRVQAVDQGQKETKESIRTLIETVENQGEMLDELVTFIKENHTNELVLTDIRYNSAQFRLQIHAKEADLSRATNQSLLCNILFRSKEGVKKTWPMDELVEKFAGSDIFSISPKERKVVIERVRQTAYNLNRSIASQTGVRNFLVISNSQILVNPTLSE